METGEITGQVNATGLDTKLKKVLISKVKRERILYDPEHEHFSNVEYRNTVWTNIADSIGVDGMYQQQPLMLYQ